MALFCLQQQFTLYLHLVDVLRAFLVQEDLFANLSTFYQKAEKSP